MYKLGRKCGSYDSMVFFIHYDNLLKSLAFLCLALSAESTFLRSNSSYIHTYPGKKNLNYNLADDQVAYFPFNGDAKDYGQNNLGTVLYRATLTTDRFNNPNSAFQFFSNSYILVGTSPVLDMGTSSYTISAWIYLDRNDRNMRIFSHGSFHCSLGYMFRTNGAGLTQEFSCADGCSLTGGTNIPILDVGVWYSVVNVVERNGKGSMYVNGVLVFQSQGIVSQCSISSGVNGYIGYAPEGEQFYGKIDDLRLFNKALNQDDVQELYQIESHSWSPTLSPAASPTISATLSPTKSSSARPTIPPSQYNAPYINGSLPEQNVIAGKEQEILIPLNIFISPDNKKIDLLMEEVSVNKDSKRSFSQDTKILKFMSETPGTDHFRFFAINAKGERSLTAADLYLITWDTNKQQSSDFFSWQTFLLMLADFVVALVSGICVEHYRAKFINRPGL